MELVILETPYSGDVKRNIEYAQKCMKDCLLRGEAPYASHLLYTQENVLNDDIQKERNLGIEAGLCWGKMAKKTVVYMDYGLSTGMEYGIERAKKEKREIEFRYLKENKNGT